MSKRYLTKPEMNAILAGLRYLQAGIECPGSLSSGLEAVLADDVAEPITPDEIDQLIEDINCREVQMHVEGDGYDLES